MRSLRDDLEPDVPPDEAAALDDVAARLVASRPVPNPMFRGRLQREVAARGAPRPSLTVRARLAVAACLAASVILLGGVGIGLAGSGPFAPPASAQQSAAR